ncbi:MAG: tRNA pseudouridine(55) synthase TruB [Clostridia bacterium]
MDGFVCLLKPPGMTSSNAVYDVRRIFSEKRAGHLGTLDPGAAGVLPICIGRATRLFDFLVDKQKQYVCEIAFGVQTDTQDVYGRVTASDNRVITPDELADVIPLFIGVQQQTAPIYSALKVDGKKMYDLARAGAEVQSKTREITISELTLFEQTGVNRYLLRLNCSRGTYVRTICEDIGRKLGSVAHMSLLVRTASGPFTLEKSHSVVELETLKAENRLNETVISCEEALSFLPRIDLPADRRTPTMNGLETTCAQWKDTDVRVYCDGFLGIGAVTNNRLKLTVHLY